MTNPIAKAEQLSIEAQTLAILDDLRSGDLDSLRSACERLSVLAENNYQDLLARTVTLIAAANRLVDRVRARLITTDDEEAASNKLSESLIALLNEMRATTPIGRLVIPEHTADPEIGNAVRSLEKRTSTLGSQASAADADDEEDERALLNLIVRSKDPQTQGTLLVAENIQKSYRRTNFRLQPLSLELRRGEILGIVGVNASGKTTLLRMLMGDLRPSGGNLRYPTLKAVDERPNWRRIKHRIAYVGQTLPWWPGRVFDNLRYVASLYGTPVASIDSFVELLLQRYGLDRFKDASWGEISGGYRTRFEIARALLSNPDILVLDEPLAFLDILSQQTVLRQLRQLAENRARPIGVIVTSQQLYEIEAIATRLIVIEGGKTLFSGPVSALADLIDDFIIEFRSTGRLTEMKTKLLRELEGRALIASETGYIAVFHKGDSAGTDFNDIVELLGRQAPGKLSYARDISRSCRVLFEPRLADYIRTSIAP
jgi:ABC-2 type transport system ATP-binding protein